jgi:CBS domain
MKVKDVMHKGVDWVSPDTPVTELAKLMREHDIGAIPIGENDRLIGICTEHRHRRHRQSTSVGPAATSAAMLVACGHAKNGTFATLRSRPSDSQTDATMRMVSSAASRAAAIISSRAGSSSALPATTPGPTSTAVISARCSPASLVRAALAAGHGSRRRTIDAYGMDFADFYRRPVERSPRNHDIGSGAGFGS